MQIKFIGDFIPKAFPDINSETNPDTNMLSESGPAETNNSTEIRLKIENSRSSGRSQHRRSTLKDTHEVLADFDLTVVTCKDLFEMLARKRDFNSVKATENQVVTG